VLGYRLLQGPPPGAAPGGPPEPLWPGGPRLYGARFNPKGPFGGIYLASDPVTALTEVGAVLENPSVPRTTLRTPPWAVFAVEGIVTGTLDLTDSRNQECLGTSLSELTGDWRYTQARYLRGESSMPPTQLLGKVAYESERITGLLYRAARNTVDGLSLVVFPDRLDHERGDSLAVYDPHKQISQRLP